MSDPPPIPPRPPELSNLPGADTPPGPQPAGQRHQHRPERVCVIGAGASGLAACKALLERRLPFQCFETSDRVGGLWVLGNVNGRSAAYRSLHLDTSRDRSAFSDFPMPRTYPDYPSHALIAQYLDSYARHFGLMEHIRFGVAVERVTRGADGRFDVASSGGGRNTFDAVVVANGHHWDPSFPATPGSFSGLEFHSHAYVDPSEPYDLRGRRVLVVGFGNSAVDIACDLARADGPSGSAKVFLSVRRGAWVLPKYVFGRPLDQTRALPGFMPRRVRQLIAELWYRAAVGDPTRFGLPKPDHGLGDAHPTVSDDLLGLLEQGRILAKPAILGGRGSELTFADGTSEPVDAILYATGYKVSFPFFDADWVSAPKNELPLYLHVFHPDLPRLLFIGLCQPLGPIVPLAEAQSKLVAAHLAGDYATPPQAAMHAAIQAERERVRKRFGSSPRHTMQVDFDDYLAALRRETLVGAERVQQQ